jgi:hypothetical protein
MPFTGVFLNMVDLSIQKCLLSIDIDYILVQSEDSFQPILQVFSRIGSPLQEISLHLLFSRLPGAPILDSIKIVPWSRFGRILESYLATLKEIRILFSIERYNGPRGSGTVIPIPVELDAFIRMECGRRLESILKLETLSVTVCTFCCLPCSEVLKITSMVQFT